MVQAKSDIVTNNNFVGKHLALLIMSGLLSHSKNSMPVWFCLFWWAEELHALSYALLIQYRKRLRESNSCFM